MPVTRFWRAVPNHPVSSWVCFLWGPCESSVAWVAIAVRWLRLTSYNPECVLLGSQLLRSCREEAYWFSHFQICQAHTNIWRLKGQLEALLSTFTSFVLSSIYFFLLIDDAGDGACSLLWAFYPRTASQPPFCTSAFPYAFPCRALVCKPEIRDFQSFSISSSLWQSVG